MERRPVSYALINAFTSTPFKGNPAAVCLLEKERDDEWLRAVAGEFNVNVTAFLICAAAGEIGGNPRFHIRWFTPVVEVEVCGHATLAAAHFLFMSGVVRSGVVEFLCEFGVLSAKEKIGGVIELDFPAISVVDCESGDVFSMPKTLNGEPVVDVKKTAGPVDLLVELSSGKAVTELLPDFDELIKCPVQRGVIITGPAPSESGFDFFTRFFCPNYGVNEASSRGGVLDLHLDVETQRVLVRGEAVTVMTGTLLV